jgi:PTH1 family peptidyl-tRNA hydrolase
MKLIVGLGNPGRFYANNRHNIGFACLNYFARQQGIRWDKKQCLARTGTGKIGSNQVVLAKPQTYMNLSGQAVSLLVRKLNIKLDDLAIVHDDLDLPLGRVRTRLGGISAGHKGVESIITELGSQDFIRIRVGISRPEPNEDAPEISEAAVVRYVLGDFAPDEKQTVKLVIAKVSEVIACLLTECLTVVMNKYN